MGGPRAAAAYLFAADPVRRYFFLSFREAVSEAWAQKEPLMPMCVGPLTCTVTVQVLRAWFALSGVVDRLNLLTDRETDGAIGGEEHAR